MKEMKLMLLVLLVAVTGCKSSDNSLTLLRAKEWQLKSMTENGKEVKVIDWRYDILVFLWRLIPRWLWTRLKITT